MPVAPEDIAVLDPAYWAVLKRIRLGTGVFTFKDHEYQKVPMRSRARRICHMKGTQGGFTQIEVLRSLHGMIHRRFPQGVLYMFPTTDNVREFSKSRFGPLIRDNPETIGKFVRTPRQRGTDTASLKRVHDAYLFLRGARLTQNIEGAGSASESVQLRSIPVDKIVFDELDLMNEDVIEKARGRMGASRVKEEVFIANPTLPDFGIDRIFGQSDQRHLFRKCQKCSRWVCAEVAFPDCVALRKDGTGYIACPKCGSPVGLEQVCWVPALPENGNPAIVGPENAIEGYRWSQLSSAFNDPGEILRAFNDPPEGNLGDVYRLRLGLPYAAAENRLTADRVYQCCGDRVLATNSIGPCAMGVDVGKVKHVVIGTRTGPKKYQILKLARVSKWEDLADLARRFNVRSAVIDIRPYEDEARAFQKAEPYPIFLCQYDENRVQEARFDQEQGLVRVNRTEIMDRSHRAITEHEIVLPRRGPEVEEFARSCCKTAKMLEENAKSGTKIYRYHKIGDKKDDYRHALNYFLMAASPVRLATAKETRTRRPTHAVNELAVA